MIVPLCTYFFAVLKNRSDGKNTLAFHRVLTYNHIIGENFTKF